MRHPLADPRRWRVLGKAALFVLAVGGWSIVQPAPANSDSFKVTICHIPPGNPENEHTIDVGVAAVPAHLAHGDHLGECGGGGGGS